MKKLSLTILLTSLIGFNSYSNPINPNSIGFEKIVYSFDNTLTSLFNHDVELDESLRQSCINFVSRETEGINNKNEENLAYFYQMWELKDTPEMYLPEGLCSSLVKMILNEKFSDYIPLIDAKRFWVECIEKDNKYYLVVALK